MNSIKPFYFYIFLVFCSISCKNEPKKVEKPSNLVSFEEKIPDETQNEGEIVSEEAFLYNKQGKTPEDFIKNHQLYQIQYQKQGDLNQDGLNDMVLVVKSSEEMSTKKRYTLVLFQDKTGQFYLETISDAIFEPEYNEYGYKWYSQEEIDIEDGILQLSFYGLGPSGNVIYQFQYQEKALILNYLEVFAAGAGGQTTSYYDFRKKELEIHNINTMEEEMPTEIEKKPLKNTQYPFEKVDLNTILQENE